MGRKNQRDHETGRRGEKRRKSKVIDETPVRCPCYYNRQTECVRHDR